MKPAGFPLLILAVAGTLAAQEPARTSARLAQEIKATLPKYEPPPPRVLDQPKDLPADPDILVLPKVTVKEYRPPTHDPDVWLTQKGARDKALTLYKRSLTDLEWALNSWFIPIIGSSPSARALSSYKAAKSFEESRRIHQLFSVVSATDPQTAQELEKERVKMEQTEFSQSRPAGHGRTK